MEPTPGGPLEEVYNALIDPAFVMVARLAKGPIGQPDRTQLLADLVEADFPGYAPVTLTADLEEAWEGDEYGELSPQIVEFSVGTLVTRQLVTHFYVTKTWEGGDVSLVACVPCSEPFVVRESDSVIAFDVGIAAATVPD